MEPITRNEIPLKIKKKCGDIVKISFPKQGCTSDVAFIETKEIDYVLKRAKGNQYRSWLEKEIEALEMLEKTSLPTPKVYEKVVQQELNQCWLLMERLKGISLGEVLNTAVEKEQKEKLLFQYGKILKTIHLTPCPKEWQQANNIWLDDMLDNAMINLTHYQVDGSPSLLQKLKQNKPYFYPQRLIHGDFTVDNVLISDGKISGVIDWSGGAYGDPRYDVALAIRPKPFAFQTEEDRIHFFAGYGERLLNKMEYTYFAEGLYEFF